MAKRQFCLLAQPFDAKKHHIAGSFVSDKLDGIRAIWDGGVSRGIPASLVPWANTEKDDRYIEPPAATGLWTRLGNTIQAPDWWLDGLPKGIPLDGELYLGPQMFQTTMSIVRRMTPGPEWNNVQYMLFDSPDPRKLFAPGIISETMFRKNMSGSLEWALARNPDLGIPERIYYNSFQDIYLYLKARRYMFGPQVHLHEQTRLPRVSSEAQTMLGELLNAALDKGDEGVIIRAPNSMWVPERSHNLLKYKPWHDGEGTVTGYTWGKKTDKGSKLLGLMGAVVLDYDGKRLEVSGFTDAERVMVPTELATPESVREWDANHGQLVSPCWYNPRFPIGTTITVKYRELTDAGIPKECRYHRIRKEQI